MFELNKLSLNIKKSNVIIFTRCRKFVRDYAKASVDGAEIYYFIFIDAII